MADIFFIAKLHILNL